jgi:hypothetical protein
MATPSSLQTAFAAYLESTLDAKQAVVLADELLRAGLANEAEGLWHFIEQSQNKYALPAGARSGSSCSVDWLPPDHPQTGDLWFDALELIPMMFVSERPGTSPDIRGWMAIRPVQVWQFRAFLQTAKPNRIGRDRFDAERFDNMDPLAPVVSLYPSEAEAYALWFGKWSVGTGALMRADRVLNAQKRLALSLDGLRLWDLSCPSSGRYVAVSFTQPMFELTEEILDDSDYDPSVGFATYAFLKLSSRVSGWTLR